MPTETQELTRKKVVAGELLNSEIKWKKSDNPVFPYFAVLDGIKYTIRVNDFPEETLYTLIIAEDGETLDFDEWPALWKRPKLT